MPAPAEFKIPTIGQETNQGGILRAVTGNLGHQRVQFRLEKKYNAKRSAAEGKEVYDQIEVAVFKNDPYSESVVWVKDLSNEQRLATMPLYERFLTQKDSSDTLIENWDAAHDSEKLQLAMLGISTVEQLGSWPSAQIFRLGNGGAELVERAKRHLDTKAGNRASQDNAELLRVIEENRQLRELDKKREDDYFALLARMEELENGKNKTRRKGQALPEAVTEAA